MKKSSDVKHITQLLRGLKKIRSKRHCKLSRKEQMVLYETILLFEQSKITRTRRKKFLPRFFRVIKFIAKLLKKMIGGMFSL